MMHTLTTGGNLNCGTDGGLKANRGTFGLVVLVEDKKVWEGCGPVDGNPDTASSKQSKLFGYAALNFDSNKWSARPQLHNLRYGSLL
jgi:hypothetical protein